MLTSYKAFNVLENKDLRWLFLLLREALRDGDIPHRTTIKKRTYEMFEKRLSDLSREMKV